MRRLVPGAIEHRQQFAARLCTGQLMAAIDHDERDIGSAKPHRLTGIGVDSTAVATGLQRVGTSSGSSPQPWARPTSPSTVKMSAVISRGAHDR
jgi:hypothetical protein